jgi:mannan endo-1,4-beta-mannosidase
MAAKFWHRRGSRRTNAIVGASLAGIGALIYFSPAGSHAPFLPDKIVHKVEQMPRKPQPTQASKHKTVTVTKVKVQRPPSRTRAVKVAVPDKKYVYRNGSPAGAPTGIAGCSSFQSQQQAQTVYLADLSDPFALDGPAGPHNGDGIACSSLAVDPSKPKSTPVDPYVWPSPNPPGKHALINPAKKYFGLAADGLPSNSTLFDSLDGAAGKAPSLVQWSENFDSAFPFAKIATAWRRNALPVITWTSSPSDLSSPDLSRYSLANIAAGRFDAYLRSWGAGVAAQKLPVVIRLDQEMNGNWYIWGAGFQGNGIRNTPADYVAAWRHVWNIFNSIGANSYAIWAFTPSRVDTLRADGVGSSTGFTTVQQDYPGDQYVDWVGMSGFQYQPSENAGYWTTFGRTLGQLKALTGKPIYVAEAGAAQSILGADRTAVKAEWTRQTLSGLAADPRVVGVTWYDNNEVGRHTVNGKAVETDWTFTSSIAAQAAFRAGVADARYSAGVMPPYLTGQ